MNIKIFKEKYGYIAAIIAIMLIGFFLRLHDLGNSYVMDELLAIDNARIPFMKIPDTLRLFDVHPPLYYWFLHILIVFVGYHREWLMRLPSVLFAVFSIPLMARLASRIGSKWTGILAALLLAFSAFHISWSLFVRPYTLLGFFILLSFIFYINLLDRPSWKNAAGYIVSGVCLVYVHNYGVFTLLSQGLHFLIWKWRNSQRGPTFKVWAGIVTIIVLFYLPWYSSALYQLKNGSYDWISGYWHKPVWRVISQVFIDYSGRNIHFAFIWICLSISALFLLWKHFNRWTVIFWCLFPLILPVLISVFIKPIFFSKYGIQTFLFFILLIAQGLAIPLDSGWKKVIAVVLVCILTIPQIGRCDLAFEKTKWREVIQVINAKAQKDDLLLINPYFMTSSVRIYLNRPIETMSWDSFAAHKAWETKRNQHIWVLTTGSKVDIKEDFKNKFSLLLPVYALDKTDSFRNISLMEFEIK